MEVIKWSILVILPFLLGVLLVKYLTVHPLEMSRYLLATSLVSFVLVAVLAVAFRWKPLLIAIPLCFLLFLAGYAAMTRTFLSREDPRPVPELTRTKGNPGLGHTAVIYFTHGEPETYDPIGWINQFNEFDEQGIPFVPLMARPIFINQLRAKYLEVGRSDHRKMHYQMVRSLERAYREAGDRTTQFYVSFLDDNPRPDAAVVQALNDGASRIIISEVFLTISNHTAAISADAIHSQYDVPALVNEAEVPEGFSLINLGAWNDDPIVIQAIKAKIDAQMH